MREMKVIKVMVSAFYIAILLGGLMGKGSLHMFVNNFELRIKGDVVLYWRSMFFVHSPPRPFPSWFILSSYKDDVALKSMFQIYATTPHITAYGPCKGKNKTNLKTVGLGNNFPRFLVHEVGREFHLKRRHLVGVDIQERTTFDAVFSLQAVSYNFYNSQKINV
jgi:hypothetical protein